MAQRGAVSKPDVSVFAKLCNTEPRQGPSAQPENECHHNDGNQRRTCDLPSVCIGNQQPEIPNGEQRGVGDKIQQPELRDAGAVCDRVGHGRCHFTVNVAASLVDKYCGWYMDSTRVGLTRKTPGFTTLSR